MSHYNYVHAGVEILSMSKRIMNKVFDASNDCGVKIYYQDTDSTHLHYDDVIRILNRHKEKHNQDLVGQGLGNFHVDFSKDGAVSEIYGTESYVLGKKTYIDMLESANKDNNISNDEHFRMRGIPTACIKCYAQQNNITVLGIYKKLYEGEALTFDTTNDLTKFVCKKKETKAIQFQML